MMTAIWSSIRAFGPPAGGNGGQGGGNGNGGGGGKGKKNKAPQVEDCILNFDHITATQNTAPVGQAQALCFTVPSA